MLYILLQVGIHIWCIVVIQLPCVGLSLDCNQHQLCFSFTPVICFSSGNFLPIPFFCFVFYLHEKKMPVYVMISVRLAKHAWWLGAWLAGSCTKVHTHFTKLVCEQSFCYPQ